MDEFEVPEKPDSGKERVVGLIIAVIAVVLAIVSALAHETHNDEILAHVDAADQYSFYQAKKERRAELDLSVDQLRLDLDRFSPTNQTAATQLITAHQNETARLQAEGKDIQAKGDELMKESQQLAAKARVLDLGEIGLQIAVVLCSITILTEQNLFVRLGVGIAAVGVLVALSGMFL